MVTHAQEAMWAAEETEATPPWPCEPSAQERRSRPSTVSYEDKHLGTPPRGCYSHTKHSAPQQVTRPTPGVRKLGQVGRAGGGGKGRIGGKAPGESKVGRDAGPAQVARGGRGGKARPCRAHMPIPCHRRQIWEHPQGQLLPTRMEGIPPQGRGKAGDRWPPQCCSPAPPHLWRGSRPPYSGAN